MAYRNKAAKDGFPGVEGGAKTLYEVFEYSVKRHGDKKCLGWRPMTNGKPGPYEYWTYNETRGADPPQISRFKVNHHGVCHSRPQVLICAPTL